MNPAVPCAESPSPWRRGALTAQEARARGEGTAPPSSVNAWSLLAGVLASFLGAVALHAAPSDPITAPAKNWVLPLFSQEGYRRILARGSEARALSARRFEVVDLNLTFFTGDASNHVETIILSPAATFLPDENLAHGEHSVRFIRDDVEATGTRWRYEHANKKISLDGAVRVTFRAEVKDLLR